METRSLACVAKKVRQVGEGGVDARTRYFSTVDFATAMPSLPSSPAMRGAPHVGLAADSLRIRSRISLPTGGRPSLLWRLKRVQ